MENYSIKCGKRTNLSASWPKFWESGSIKVAEIKNTKMDYFGREMRKKRKLKNAPNFYGHLACPNLDSLIPFLVIKSASKNDEQTKIPKNAQKPVHCPSLLLLKSLDIISNRAATLMAVISFHIPPHITHFPTNPPFTYPHIHFLSPIKHPNISALSSNKCGRMPRQWAIHLFPLPFLLLLIQLSLKERAKASDIVEFLFQNQRICLWFCLKCLKQSS